MNDTPIYPSRHSFRLKNYDYSSAGMYFVTVCCHAGECRFGSVKDGRMVLNAFGVVAERVWFGLESRFEGFVPVLFQPMPNHLHVLFTIEGRGRGGNVAVCSVGSVIGAYKSIVSNECRKIYESKGLKMGKFWQRNYFEHVVRSQRGYENIAEYMVLNPGRWDKEGFVGDLEFFRRMEAL